MLKVSGDEDRSATGRSVADSQAQASAVTAGTYLTNGVFLYRVVRATGDGSTAVADLEDCYFLDVVRVPVGALRARGVRVVRSARVDG